MIKKYRGIKMKRDDKIKEILYDINQARGDYDLLADILLSPPGYTILTEFSITQDESEDDDFAADFDQKMSEKMEELEDNGEEADLMRIIFYKKD